MVITLRGMRRSGLTEETAFLQIETNSQWDHVTNMNRSERKEKGSRIETGTFYETPSTLRL